MITKIQNFLNLYPALQNLKKHGHEHDDSYHNGCYVHNYYFPFNFLDFPFSITIAITDIIKNNPV